MSEDNVIGQRIAALREAKGMSQAALARMIGISQPSLWAIEKGATKELKHDTVVGLSKCLGISMEALMNPDPAASLTLIEEAELSLIFRKLTPEDQGHLIATARAYRDRMVPAKRKAEPVAAAVTPAGPAPAASAPVARASAPPAEAPRRSAGAGRAAPSPTRARRRSA